MNASAWLFAAAVAGALFGIFAPSLAPHLDVVNQIFLRLIRSLIAPLVLGIVVRGIADAGQTRGTASLVWRTVLYCEIVTTLAMLIGGAAVVIGRPGAGLTPPADVAAAPSETTLASLVESLFPSSVFAAMANNDVLPLIVFAALFGTACSAIGDRARPVLSFLSAVTDVAFKCVGYVMWLAPAAVFAASASAVARYGTGVLSGLGQLAGLAYAAQAAYMLVVLGGVLLLVRAPVLRFVQAAREPFLVAFATTSSAAALPQAIVRMTEFGVPERISGLVIPLSLTLNTAGSTLHITMSTLFVAQAAGRSFTLSEYALLFVVLKLVTKGVAGVPRANFLILASVFGMFALPVSALPLLLAIDPLIDMIRTGVNILSHCTAAVALSRWGSKEA